jgi:glycine betaine/proline transport system ATP-binding protein
MRHPADIFSAPASDYVAEFVANMNPLGVLTARDVMPDETEDPEANVCQAGRRDNNCRVL